MTVKELIDKLSKYNPDFEVKFGSEELGGYADICQVYDDSIIKNTVILNDEYE